MPKVCTWATFIIPQQVLGKHKWLLWLSQEKGQPLQSLAPKGSQGSWWEISKARGGKRDLAESPTCPQDGSLSAEAGF